MSALLRRPVVLTAVLTGAIALVQPVIGAAPAYAAACGDVAGVTMWSDLQTAFGAGGTVALNAGITEHEDGTSATLLRVGSGESVTLDLAGCPLSIDDVQSGAAGIAVPAGASLTIEDTIGGGTLAAEGGTGLPGNAGGAGIGDDGGTPSGSVTIAGGTITATAGDGGDSDGSLNGGKGGAGLGDGGGATPAGGTTLSITGGTLTAQGGAGGADTATTDGGDGGAGIGGGGDADAPAVTVTNGTINATGGGGQGGNVGYGGGAGIGGGGDASGATIQITNGVVNAVGGGGGVGLVGGGGGAGIGGGGFGSGGAVTIGGTVTASGGPGGAGIEFGGPGNDVGNGGAFVFGAPPSFGSLSMSLGGVLVIPFDTTETVPGGATVLNEGTIVIDGSLENEGLVDDSHGALTGTGTLTNDGSILVGQTGTVVDTAHSGLLTVEHHFFDVTSWELDGGSVPVSVPPSAYDAVDVYADSFGDGAVSLPPAPTPPSSSVMFAGWFTAASGGQRVFSNTSLTHVLAGDDDSACAPCSQPLFAQYVTITTPPGSGSGSTPPPSSTLKVTSSADPSTSGDAVTFTATVTPTPTAGCGTVTWLIDNAAPPAGTASGSTGGTFSLGPISSLAVGNHPVTAQFTGCATAGAATGTAEQAVGQPGASPSPSPSPSSGTTDPTITAKVTSAHVKRHGWYRSPVHVTFSCVAGSSALATPCPDPVTLSKSKANQSVSASVSDSDGGAGSVTVTGINIDRNAPVLHVIRHGHTLTCKGSDALSGLASCTIHRTKHTHHGVATVHWTATATDKAGNTTTKDGHFTYQV